MENDVPTSGINKEFPKIGVEFDLEQMAYNYYNHYARGVGFSIQKDSTTHRKDKTISIRVLVCSNQGEYRKHPRGYPLKRLPTRIDSDAKLVIKLQSDDSKHSIIEFLEKHNHLLKCSDQVRMLRSQRKIESGQARLIENMLHNVIQQKCLLTSKKEYTQTLDLILEIVDQDGPVNTYKVTSFKFSCARTVMFSSPDNSLQCSCKHFQYMGMICAHSMKILHTHQVYDLPSQYYLSRWTINAKNGVGIEEPKKPIQGNNGPSTLMYSDLAYMALSLAMKGTSTETSSTFTKNLLAGVLGELDNFLKSTQDDQTEKITNAADENNENMGQTSIQLSMSANITL